MGVYEGSPLHSLKMNTSEMEVSVHYRNEEGKEDVYHLPLKNLKKMGKMYNHGITYRVIIDNLHQELTCYRLVLGLLRFSNALM